MPLYNYTCFDTGETMERLFKHSERPSAIEHEGCTYVYTLSPIARTSSSWSTFQYGVSGKYDRTLKTHIMSDSHRDLVASARGLRPMRERSQWDRLEAAAAAQEQEDAQSTKRTKLYQDTLKSTGSVDKAFDTAYCANDKQIAKSASADVLKKRPQAKHIKWERLKAQST